ncbi:hypothetical protein L202_06616 [Cryptococcus amylolentus CBS 6039]|uniref:F-box domain-containing protein n=1 Tax=Cryptococcus amylolentus CBS 6039 TaxID=1295533 RepID=A0A1E3HGL0_9TREE|nr:hypothetical protein L202_06616 [Cryptococcus amylolentus CBS 6039]ODN75483.1 hypothetical protein L202_06616 [Cryptococcus amylolentus CBS 6039]
MPAKRRASSSISNGPTPKRLTRSAGAKVRSPRQPTDNSADPSQQSADQPADPKRPAGKSTSVRKQPVAKEALWQDIPASDPSSAGDQATLLSLPREVLDVCFGTTIDLGLQMRDYVALAGVSRYFRLCLDDQVFQELYLASRPKYVDGDASGRKYVSERIFSRNVPNWSVPPPQRSFKALDKLSLSLPPHDSGSDQDKKLRSAYEQIYARCRQVYQEGKDEIARQQRERVLAKRVVKRVVVDGVSRAVLAAVPGRKNGEVEGEKDENGIPQHLSAGTSTRSGVPSLPLETDPKEAWRPWKLKLKKLYRQMQQLIIDHRDMKPVHVDDILLGGAAPSTTLWIKYSPETGEKLPHDYYPSPWRTRAAEVVASKWISKSEAIRTFKVGEGEMACLKHFLVFNSLNPKLPAKVFSLAAVQALALRSHGGPIGHHDHVIKSRAKAFKSIITRRAKTSTKDNSSDFPTSTQTQAPTPGLTKNANSGGRYRRPAKSIDPSDEDDSGAKYGIDKECGSWYWRGAFFDWVSDQREQRALRPEVDNGPPDHNGSGNDGEDDGGTGGNMGVVAPPAVLSNELPALTDGGDESDSTADTDGEWDVDDADSEPENDQ